MEESYFSPQIKAPPSRLLIFVPHPDDLAICCGGLVRHAVNNKIETHAFLMTLGGDARMPEDVFRHYGYQVTMPNDKYAAREQIRKREAENEALFLGLAPKALHIGTAQSWSDIRHTAPSSINEDLSISNLSHFVPGPITQESVAEITQFIDRCFIPDAWIALPLIPDKLLVHNMTSFLVTSSLISQRQDIVQNGNIVMYQCLSSVLPSSTNSEQHVLLFNEEVMSVKAKAINCHWSMRRRREEYGGYENRQNNFYDAIVRDNNEAIARSAGKAHMFGERYFLPHYTP